MNTSHATNEVIKPLNMNFRDAMWRKFITYLPYLWLLLFFLAPFIIVLKISFATPVVAQPPFTELFDLDSDTSQWWLASWENYQFLTEDNLYWVSYFKSIKVAFISTIICLLIGYPMAYGIARATPIKRNILLMLVILPFWTSFLLRVYAWMGLLGKNGIINSALMHIGIVDSPLQLLYTDMAVYLGIVYTYIPFMILPLYANLEKMDTSLHDAAADLGARPWQVFINITLPLSIPWILAGSLLVFIPAIG